MIKQYKQNVAISNGEQICRLIVEHSTRRNKKEYVAGQNEFYFSKGRDVATSTTTFPFWREMYSAFSSSGERDVHRASQTDAS